MNYTVDWRLLLYLIACAVLIPITLVAIGLCKVLNSDKPVYHLQIADKWLKGKLKVSL